MSFKVEHGVLGSLGPQEPGASINTFVTGALWS